MATTSTATTAATLPAENRGGIGGVLRSLHEIKIGGGGKKGEAVKIDRKNLAYLLRNLATLVSNGLSLSKALATMSKERSLAKYSGMLRDLRNKIEQGESFSGSLRAYPQTFNELTVNQIQVGERSGTIADTLRRIADQVEKSNELRAKIIKRLSYPLLVSGAGSCVVAFMLMFVVPQFEETYSKANIDLPLVTRILIFAGDVAVHWGWLLPVSAVSGFFLLKKLRKNENFAKRMDGLLLRLPLLGDWLRDIAVLQFTEVMGIMMQSGFRLVDALSVSAGSVGNRAVRAAVKELLLAVTRGERLSHELAKHGDMFPPVVSQLVIIGEETGKLGEATTDVRAHLRHEVERKAEAIVSFLEPCLTLILALAIGTILMAIYMPMFGMIDAIEGSGKPG